MAYIASYLSEMVLYTISNPYTAKKFVTFLEDNKFVKEGDQSTMIHRLDRSRFTPEKFHQAINRLSKEISFEDKDTISLITPGYLRKLHGSSKKFKLGDIQPIIKRFLFQYNSNKGTFSHLFTKRDFIIDVTGTPKQ